MKYKDMGLKEAFLYARQKRPVIRPKIAFIEQLMKYEKRIFGLNTFEMVDTNRRGYRVKVPDFYSEYCPELIDNEVDEKKMGAIKKDQVMEQLSERSVL